ncbi:MAG: carbon-nitrogen hydrolase family protein [Anaerolineaceae bacterium]|nr:carbon-nitrogen hydrolase family protein [Anaerolineaceae bacterium]
MSDFRVALLQMAPGPEGPDANLCKADAFCREAKQRGADIALFPEMWNNGYQLYRENPDQGSLEDWIASALQPDDDYLTHFRKLADELDMAIAATYLEAWDGLPRNTVTIFDRHGKMAHTYAKVHTCQFNPEKHLTPGEDFPVCELDTAIGPVKIGTMICYDREFPESARILMLHGAEIILTPNACKIDMNRKLQFRTRAMENAVGVAMTNYAEPRYNGHSIAYDGVTYPFSEEDQDRVEIDPLIIEAGCCEGVVIAHFDLDRLRAFRRQVIWGNAFRRPHCYQALIDETVDDPFIREDARR